MHRQAAGAANVSQEFMVFAENSIHVFPHGNRAGCRACHPAQLDEQAEEAVFLETADMVAPNRVYSLCREIVGAPVSMVSMESVCANPWTFPNLIADPPFAEDVRHDGRFVQFSSTTNSSRRRQIRRPADPKLVPSLLSSPLQGKGVTRGRLSRVSVSCAG